MTEYRSLFLRHGLLLTVTLFGISALLFIPVTHQDPGYHQFADQRKFYGVSHFFNVITSLPFIAVGVAGMLELCKPIHTGIVSRMISAYRLFFTAIVGVGIGSVHYHLSPANETLIWDRLPMTIAFMAFFTIIIAEYVSVRLAEWLFYPLILVGLFSVGYWYMTELLGRGDLRLYGLIQFLPLLLMPLILLLYSSRFSHGSHYWLFFGLYALAKIVELYDEEIYGILQGISGHSLKHLLAALGCAVFLMQIKKRHQDIVGVS